MFPIPSERIALKAGKKSITYQEFNAWIDSYSRLFSCTPGDRVVIFSENRMEWIFAFYAIWKRGGIPVPIDFMAARDDVAYIIQDCTPAVIFSSNNCRKVLDKALAATGTQYTPIIFEDLSAMLPEQVSPNPNPNPNDPAVIIYTSGTTGSPKGVMLTYDNLMANIEGVTRDVPIYNENDRVMIMLPLHHIFPLMGSMIAPLHVQGTVVLSPSLSPEDVIETLQNGKITLVIGVPRFYSLIAKGIRDKINASAIARMLFALASKVGSLNFSRKIFKSVHQKFGGVVRYLVCGGAALDAETSKTLTTLGFEILEGYGMTESAPMITFTRPGNYIQGSGGQVLPATTAEIRDGEIVAKGRNVMKGYFKRPEETAEVLKDGWLHTGDLGHIDENGFVYITGRKKEILVLSNGKNINPTLVESKLQAASAYISEAGVFLKNDVLQAILVPDLHRMKYDGIEDFEAWFRQQVIEPLNANSSPYQRIMKFYLTTEELPKTRLGKIQRFRLGEIADRFIRKKDLTVQEPTIKEYAIIRDYLENETKTKIFPNDHLEMDVALDSLAKITLLVYIENTFGVKIPEEEFMNHHTVAKLSEYIHEKKTHTRIENINWSEILKERVKVSLPKPGIIQAFIAQLSRVVLGSYFRIRSEGKTNIPSGPCIIAPNHQSAIDSLFITPFLKNRIAKNTLIYAKEKHWRKRWMQFMARKNNVVLLDINKDLKLSLQNMAAALKAGKNILIFPEGTRTRDGKPGSFKKTFAILSQELNIPVVPVVIDGAFKALPSGKWLPRPWRRISVKYLKPVYPEKMNYDALKELVEKRVLHHLAAS